MADIAGVYSITNLSNGKRYIGSAANIRTRWNVHLCYLRKNKHHSTILQRAWNKHGNGEFLFEIIEECEKDKDIILARENHWFGVYAPEYNILKEARSRLGTPHSEATKAKMKGRPGVKGPKPPEVGRKISAAKKGCVSPMKGRRFSEEHKEKIAAAQRGKPRPYADTGAARNWVKNLTDEDRKAFYAQRAATLRDTLQKKWGRASL